MDIEEVIKWLKIMKADLNSFPEVSSGKKIEALAEAIRLLKNEQSKEPSSSEKPNKSEIPTGSDDCISRQDVLSEIIRFSTEEGASVECQQLYCDVNNMPSVTPQEPIRPKGKWISYHYGAYYECSNCHERNNSRYDNYCKFCGAKMEGV